MSSETWIEWGVRRIRGDVGSIAFMGHDQRTARKCAEDWPGVLVRRTVTAGEWRDDHKNDPATVIEFHANRARKRR